jgi:hypothetical protein
VIVAVRIWGNVTPNHWTNCSPRNNRIVILLDTRSSKGIDQFLKIEMKKINDHQQTCISCSGERAGLTTM